MGIESSRRKFLAIRGSEPDSTKIIGINGGLREAYEKVKIVSATEMPVLLLGETGSGKELIARAIHENSKRKENPFIRVNCGAISPDLIDSELFGFEKGSFTGAIGSKKGWFERAHGGTLFLDEIGEMSESVQVRLLRILQDGTFDRIGGQVTVKVDVRIVAATHRNLYQMVASGAFREDLWFRISSFPIAIPPLRDRTGDLPELANSFMARSAMKFGVPTPLLSGADIEILKQYDWPGNIRELEAVLARAVLLAQNGLLNVSKAMGYNDPAFSQNLSTIGESTTLRRLETASVTPADRSLDGVVRQQIEKVLYETFGRIDGPFGAAQILQIHPNTLRSRMKKLGLDSRKFKKRI